jgi:hypothetical protein
VLASFSVPYYKRRSGAETFSLNGIEILLDVPSAPFYANKHEGKGYDIYLAASRVGTLQECWKDSWAAFF